jgi:hypothetical protein
MATVQDRSLGELLKELSRESSLLVRQEVDLARTEVSEKASRLAHATGHLALGGAIAVVGGLVLLAAVVTGVGALLDTFLSTELSAFLAPLLVGGVIAFIGYGMVRKSLDALGNEGLVPQKTKETLQENKVWLKERTS